MPGHFLNKYEYKIYPCIYFLLLQSIVIIMNLNEWCAMTGQSKKEIARQLGGISPRSVFRWATAERFPKPTELLKISEITKGAVTANDFVKQWAERNGQKK